MGEEGGRHTPFFTNYRPQFFFRTADGDARGQRRGRMHAALPTWHRRRHALCFPRGRQDGWRRRRVQDHRVEVLLPTSYFLLPTSYFLLPTSPEPSPRQTNELSWVISGDLGRSHSGRLREARGRG